MLHIKVVYYGVLKDDTGETTQEIAIEAPANVRGAVNILADRYEKMRQRLDSIAYVLNDELVDLDQALSDGDIVGLLPPVSGG